MESSYETRAVFSDWPRKPCVRFGRTRCSETPWSSGHVSSDHLGVHGRSACTSWNCAVLRLLCWTLPTGGAIICFCRLCKCDLIQYLTILLSRLWKLYFSEKLCCRPQTIAGFMRIRDCRAPLQWCCNVSSIGPGNDSYQARVLNCESDLKEPW